MVGKLSKLHLFFQGVPIKMHNNIKAEEAIHYAALFSELWNASKKIVTKGSDVLDTRQPCLT